MPECLPLPRRSWTACRSALLLLLFAPLSAQAGSESVAPDTTLSGPTVRAVLRYGPPVSSLPETAWRPGGLDSRPADRWLAFDKVQHLSFSLLWTIGAQYALVNKAEWSERGALPLSASFAAMLGLSKEVYDRHLGPTRYFSRRDLVADAAGILLASGFILL